MCVLWRKGSVGSGFSRSSTRNLIESRGASPSFFFLFYTRLRETAGRGTSRDHARRGERIKRVRCQCLLSEHGVATDGWHTIVDAVRMRGKSRRVPLSPCKITPLAPRTPLELKCLSLDNKGGLINATESRFSSWGAR